ncbi:hypothetical protein CN918_30605 [Priestia megaterium]|nr:hypothetical protein CN918_30605 [Priestia megaterium]
MNNYTNKDLKLRSEYKRNYDNEGNLISIDISRSDVEKLVSVGSLWDTIKWLNANNPYLARFDITRNSIGTKIINQVLTQEERKWAENNPAIEKLNMLLSDQTYISIAEYIWEYYQEFKRRGWIEHTLVTQRETYITNNQERSKNVPAMAAKVTELGKTIHFQSVQK